MDPQFRRLTYELVTEANVAEKTGDLTKVAGPATALKRFVRRLLNSLFSQEARNFQTSNYELKSLLQNLYRSFKRLEDAIDDYDLSTYKIALSDVKDQIGQLVEMTHKLDTEISDVETEAKDAIETKLQENPAPSSTEQTPDTDGSVQESGQVSTQDSPDEIIEPEKDSEFVPPPKKETKKVKGKKLSDVSFLSGQIVPKLHQSEFTQFYARIMPHIRESVGKPAEEVAKDLLAESVRHVVDGTIESYGTYKLKDYITVRFTMNSSLLKKPIDMLGKLILQPSGELTMTSLIPESAKRASEKVVLTKSASQEIQARWTSATDSQMYSAIIVAWKAVFGEVPTINQVANTFSQLAIETSHGKGILNWNVGNIDWGKGNQHDYVMSSDTRTVGNDPTNRETYHPKRRAYNSLVEGVEDYLRLLSTPYYQKAMQVLKQNGSPQDFSHALAEKGYYDPHVRDDYVDRKGKKQTGYTSMLSANFNDFVKKYQDKKMQYDPKIGNIGISKPIAESAVPTEVAKTDWEQKLVDEIKTFSDALFGDFSPTPSGIRNIINRIEHMFDSAPVPNVQLSATAGNVTHAIEVFGLDEPTNLEFAKIISRNCNVKFTVGNQIKVNGIRYCVEFPENVKYDERALYELCSELQKQFCKLSKHRIRYYVSTNKTSSYQPVDFERIDSLSRKFRFELLKK